MLEGAVFDFDGTLFDSMHVWADIGAGYLRSLGYTPKDDVNETFRCLSLRQAALYYISEYGVKLTVEEIENGINSLIEDEYRYNVQPKRGVPALLRRLKKDGVRLCIATATDRYLVEAALNRCGVGSYFDGTFTCPEVGFGKDDPLIFERALDFLGTDKAKTAVFEDSLYALKTAKAAGFVTVGVRDRFESRQAELREYSDFYLEDFEGCEGLLEFARGL